VYVHHFERIFHKISRTSAQLMIISWKHLEIYILNAIMNSLKLTSGWNTHNKSISRFIFPN